MIIVVCSECSEELARTTELVSVSSSGGGADDHLTHHSADAMADVLDVSNTRSVTNNVSTSSAGSVAATAGGGVDEEGYSIKPQDRQCCQSSSDSDSGGWIALILCFCLKNIFGLSL